MGFKRYQPARALVAAPVENQRYKCGLLLALVAISTLRAETRLE